MERPSGHDHQAGYDNRLEKIFIRHVDKVSAIEYYWQFDVMQITNSTTPSQLLAVRV
jgi:hypothetical protein